MSWGRFWTMPDFGSDDYHRRLRELQRSASMAGKEIDQDEQIEQLRRDNRELKLYLAGLLQLLVAKGTLAQGDVEQLVAVIERAEQEAMRAESTSPDLEAIAAAARRAEGTR